MKIILVINPHAKNGQAFHKFSELKPVCDRMNIEYWITTAPLDGTRRISEWCQAHADENVLFVGVGGDGTIHEVINGTAMYPNAHVAFIPAGSGNDFARHYPSFDFNEESLRALKEWGNEVECHDLACFKGEQSGWFVNNMGIGFDAEVAYSANRSPLKKWFNHIGMGKLTYVFYVLRHLITYQPKTMTLEVDGRRKMLQNVWFITIANQPFYGGGMKISPSADSQDGVLNLTIVHQLPRVKFLTVFLSVFWGGHLRFKGVEVDQGKVIQVESEKPAFIHVDGEDAGKVSQKDSMEIEVYRHYWTLVQSKQQGS